MTSVIFGESTQCPLMYIFMDQSPPCKESFDGCFIQSRFRVNRPSFSWRWGGASRTVLDTYPVQQWPTPDNQCSSEHLARRGNRLHPAKVRRKFPSRPHVQRVFSRLPF